MPIPSQPDNLFTRPFAANGTRQIIPDASGTAGRASLDQGFPTETQLPLSQGGIAPNRMDFNGILHMLSSFAFWQQSGGQWTYNDALNYKTPNIVYHGSRLYWCLAANGPDTEAGPQSPSQAAYWRDLGEFLVDLSGITSSIASLNTSVQEILAEPSDATPVGTIIMYYGSIAPGGYIICNGSAFSATKYPRLHALLGKTTTPDMRGYFVRGYGPAGSVDPDAAGRGIGSVQGDAIRNITGSIISTGEAVHDWGEGPYADAGALYHTTGYKHGSVNTTAYDGQLAGIVFDASRVVPTAAENRPKNIALLYCIKHD